MSAIWVCPTCTRETDHQPLCGYCGTPCPEWLADLDRKYGPIVETEIAWLTKLHDWMRKTGAVELITRGVTIKLGPAPRPLVEEPVEGTEEPENVKLERARARYEMLLGRPVSAEFARDHLPR